MFDLLSASNPTQFPPLVLKVQSVKQRGLLFPKHRGILSDYFANKETIPMQTVLKIGIALLEKI